MTSSSQALHQRRVYTSGYNQGYRPDYNTARAPPRTPEKSTRAPRTRKPQKESSDRPLATPLRVLEPPHAHPLQPRAPLKNQHARQHANVSAPVVTQIPDLVDPFPFVWLLSTTPPTTLGRYAPNAPTPPHAPGVLAPTERSSLPVANCRAKPDVAYRPPVRCTCETPAPVQGCAPPNFWRMAPLQVPVWEPARTHLLRGCVGLSHLQGRAGVPRPWRTSQQTTELDRSDQWG